MLERTLRNAYAHSQTEEERDGHIHSDGEVVYNRNALRETVSEQRAPRGEVERDGHEVYDPRATKQAVVYFLYDLACSACAEDPDENE